MPFIKLVDFRKGAPRSMHRGCVNYKNHEPNHKFYGKEGRRGAGTHGGQKVHRHLDF